MCSSWLINNVDQWELMAHHEEQAVDVCLRAVLRSLLAQAAVLDEPESGGTIWLIDKTLEPLRPIVNGNP